MKKFGHYEVTAELGRGGMGVVYKGWEPSLNRKVAIKCLGDHLLNDDDLVERFTREAKATAALNNPNVIQIYFIGKEQNVPFFAMEYIEGLSLDDILKGEKSLSVKHAKNLLKQACLGLAAAHKIDLVHRDIKPANIMLTENGTLKIVDFGIARTREYGDKLTNTGEFVGTPGYLSPEVCIGKEVDERSDIFSLGIVFYEMLAGKVPFENDSPLGLMLEVVQSEIPDIRELNKKVDKKTSFILNKMIAKSPDDRYQTCNEIIRDLGNIIENETINSIKNSTQIVQNQPTKTKSKQSEKITLPSAAAVTDNFLVAKSKPQKSNKKWLVAATLFTVFAAAGFSYYGGYLPFLNNSNDDSTIALIDNDLVVAGTKSPKQEATKVNEDLDSTETTSRRQEANTVAKKELASETNKEMAEQDVAMVDNSTALDVKQLEAHINNAQKTLETPKNSQMAQMAQMAQTAQTALNNSAYNANATKSTLVESPTQVPINTTASINNASQNIAIKPIYKPKRIILNKGVVVIAFGDPAIANPVEKIIESELKQQGIKVMNEQFIPGMRQLVNNGLDLAELKILIEKNGGQAMVIANVNYVGSQQLQYAGRSSELVNAQLDIDTYDIKSGDSIGNGFGTKINYTSINATDQATDAVMEYTGQLTSNLKNKI
jgi:serine/threonine protein kinase